MIDEKNKVYLNWYSFVFQTGLSIKSCYRGYVDMRISKLRIESAKEGADADINSVLIGLYYLGFMTKEEFLTIDDKEITIL